MSNQVDPSEDLAPVFPTKEWRKFTPSVWLGNAIVGHFEPQLRDRGGRRNQPSPVVGCGHAQDGLRIVIMTDDGLVRCLDRGAGMRRHAGDDQETPASARAILSYGTVPDCVHSAEVCGEVFEHTDKMMIVRFNISGLIEERSFWWDEMSVKRHEVPVGTKVIGLVKLVKATGTGNGEDTGKATRDIHETVEREIAKMGPEAGKPLGHEPSPEDQAKALEDWKRGWLPASDNEKGKLHAG